MTLALHVAADQRSPGGQVPVNPGYVVRSVCLSSGTPAKDGFSGQMPESTRPTTTPCPARVGPPTRFQKPLSPPRARASEPADPARCSTRLGSTARTSECSRSEATWSLVSETANPLRAVV